MSMPLMTFSGTVSLTIDCAALPQGTTLTVPEKVIKAAK